MKSPIGNLPVQAALIPLLLLLLSLAACEKGDPPPLQLGDLSDSELLYVTRLVVLERAKAVALVDRPLGDALLDSLATAWGDSARSETAAGIPADPRRAGQIGRLLNRILAAELDSLIAAPRPDRLSAPLPDPPPPEPEKGQPGPG